MAALVNYKYGLQSAYDSVATKDQNTLYFIPDSGRIYKGSNLIASDNVKVVSALPEVANAFPNVIYVLHTTTGETGELVSMYALDSSKTKFILIASHQSGGTVTDSAEAILTNKTIDASANTITNLTVENFSETAICETITPLGDEYDEETVGTKFVTEKAVRDFIESNNNALNGTIDGLVKEVSYNADTAVFTFTRESGETFEVNTVVENFLKEASYDSDTHILSLTLQSGSVVQCNLEDLVPQAMNTNNVELTEDIPMIGISSVGANTSGLTTGMTMTQVLKSIFQKTINPTVTNPSASLSINPTTTSYEVGTEIATLTIDPGFSKGAYTYKVGNTTYGTQDTEVAVTNYTLTKTVGSGTAEKLVDASTDTSLPAYTDTSIHLTDDKVVYTVNVNYGAGATPVNNMGGTQNSADGTVASAIPAGSKSASKTITPYRNVFYGVFAGEGSSVNPPAHTLDSAFIRGLTKSGKEAVLNTAYTINYDGDDGSLYKIIYVAVPAKYKMTSFLLKGAVVTEEINSANMTHSTVQVAGATAGQDLTAYTVYKYVGLGNGANAATYEFKLANA